MNTKKIIEEVQNTFSEITRYPIKILTLSADFEEELGIDSVKLSEIISVLAEKYNLEKDFDSSAFNIRNIQDVADVIIKYIDLDENIESEKNITLEQNIQPENLEIKTNNTSLHNKIAFVRDTNSAIGREIVKYLEKNEVKVVNSCRDTVDFYISNILQTATGMIDDFSEEQWEMAFEESVVQFHQEAIDMSEKMKAQGGGKIISLSSIATQRYIKNHGFIAAIHTAVESLTRYLCVEFGNFNIQVNCISVGSVDSSKVAKVVGQMLKSQSKFINGTTIVVDDGQSWK